MHCRAGQNKWYLQLIPCPAILITIVKVVIFCSYYKLLYLINEFSNVASCKIKANKSIAFLHTNSKLTERETVKNTQHILFIIPTKKLRYLGVNLNRK